MLISHFLLFSCQSCFLFAAVYLADGRLLSQTCLSCFGSVDGSSSRGGGVGGVVSAVVMELPATRGDSYVRICEWLWERGREE